MEKSEVFSDRQKQPQTKGLVLTAEEKKRLVGFFSILIEIDRRTNITGTYDKPAN